MAHSKEGHLTWLAGSPWREMRLHEKAIDSGAGLRFVESLEGVVEGRKPRWILTEDDLAGILIPARMVESAQKLDGTARLRIGEVYVEGTPWLRIVCLDRDLEAVFHRFSDSVLLELSNGLSARKAVSEVLNRYRQLFAVEEQGVESQRIAGLFCELVTLEWLLRSGIDAVLPWVGPTKETHDFVFEGVHLEVKALPASGERKCRISNFRQLEAPAEVALYLIGIRLRPGSVNIEQVYQRILGCIQSDQIEHLEMMMKEAGCAVPVSAAWNRTLFAHGVPEVWIVNADFPRLIPSMLSSGIEPDGVSEVKYSVSLEKAAGCSINPQDVVERLSAE